MPLPARPRGSPGYSKNVRSLPGMRLRVGVEEVVDGRVVLVDGLLDQPQPQHPHVELDVGGGVTRDRRDVVDPFEPHGQ